jgi:nitrogen fixation/metabolism regulation signal transduction histidine kinase
VLALYDNLRPHVTLSLPTGPVVIQAEPTRLRQVLHNLLQNAIDAQTDLADPRYDIALAAEGAEARLSVADAGGGFDEGVLKHAFEPYVTTKAKGTGLGLAIVRKIVDEHGGRVELANLEPCGAKVTLVFPRGAAEGVG